MPDLLIVGASGRAAAASALREGKKPFVVDLFHDEDTKHLAPVLHCPQNQYPNGLVELARHCPPCPWMYTGALENFPDIVELISRDRPLIGNRLDVIAEIRDPYRLAYHLPDDTPRMTERLPDNLGRKRWLKKPKAGGAGFGISLAITQEQPTNGYFFQEMIDGQPMSALFYDDQFLGITQQLIGTDFLHAGQFRYAGNIAPIQYARQKEIERIARTLLQEVPLKANWGIDFIDSVDGPKVIEINPRYTAARELFDFVKIDKSKNNGKQTKVFGKGIYYANKSFAFPETGPWQESLYSPMDLNKRHDYADIPAVNAMHEAGQPVISMLVEGESAQECIAQLRQKAAILDRLL